MSTTKNVEIKQYNGTDYDIIYPKTDASLVQNLSSSIKSNGFAKIETGNYTGTGTTSGVTLTFSFIPKFISIARYSSYPSYQVFIVPVNPTTSSDYGYAGVVQVAGSASSSSTSQAACGGNINYTLQDYTFTFVNRAERYWALNESGKQYYWVALG